MKYILASVLLHRSGKQWRKTASESLSLVGFHIVSMQFKLTSPFNALEYVSNVLSVLTPPQPLALFPVLLVKFALPPETNSELPVGLYVGLILGREW